MRNILSLTMLTASRSSLRKQHAALLTRPCLGYCRFSLLPITNSCMQFILQLANQTSLTWLFHLNGIRHSGVAIHVPRYWCILRRSCRWWPKANVPSLGCGCEGHLHPWHCRSWFVQNIHTYLLRVSPLIRTSFLISSKAIEALPLGPFSF